MSEAHPPQRISVSIEVLRQEIRLANAELELRLHESLASKQETTDIRAQVRENMGIIKDHDRWITKYGPQVDILVREHATLMQEVEGLQRNKAEDLAVKSYKRYLIGGSAGVFLIMLASFLLTLWSALNAPS
jgi:hypothetical protein